MSQEALEAAADIRLPAREAEQASAPGIAALPSSLAPAGRALRSRLAFGKVLLFAISVSLFIIAITLMKEGARGLAAVMDGHSAIASPLNGLGFGWLFAYLVMSGSPVAASALTFLDAGILDPVGAYFMIAGSRLGASFIVLFIGFVYVLRGRSRSESLSIGLLSLVVTGTTYVVALGCGYPLLTSGLLDGVQVDAGILFGSLIENLLDPIARGLLGLLPQWALFVVGLGIILASFSLFDRCLPKMTLKESQLGHVSQLIYRPWVMFFLGGLITLLSMSVSVSLGILVPLSARGFVRRENLIPYIMGANITTFVDTLFAAVLLRNPAAFTVVLAEMVSIALVSTVVLLTAFRPYERAMLAFVSWLTARKRHLAGFMFVILAAPVLLMVIR